ncbi:trigger factor [Flaviflagellibacter deserti]|uniref:Trigger factor n=1 Tax=Flaviflagellibacter deserti TaxID=2267266 RepID=A0ABV9Z3H6_9HYPH
MQVTQTLSEGLKREFRITVPATDLDSRVSERLNELKDKIRINGFRPGKVPAAHLKRMYGRSVFGEVLQQVMAEANQRIVEENKIKLAMQPKVSMPENDEEVESVVNGEADLAYTVEVEVLPEIAVGDLKKIKIEKPVAEVPDSEINETLERLAEQNSEYEPKTGKSAKAANKDRVTIDFVGSIDGEKFDGGAGEDHPLVLGSGAFIPGFEDQLVGVKVGDEKVVKVSFPADYRATDLAGKDAEFAVTVKEVASPKSGAIDDELAKKLGMESLDKLKEAIREQTDKNYQQASRMKMKRALLDALDETHKFDLPPTLVEQEFANIWAQVEREIANGSAGDKSEDQLRTEYKAIAERRVRLGLLLAEIGEKNDIQVTNDEVTRAVVERARQFPGQEQMVWEYYQKTPEALAELRAPIYEEKVVDFIVELAKVTEKKVSKEELFADADETNAA